MRNMRNATGHEQRPTTTLGQHVTADHNIHRDVWKPPSVGGITTVLNVFDLHTTFRGSYPLACLTAAATALCLAQLRGNDEIRLLWSATSKSIGAAATCLSIPWAHAQPEMPHINSSIERANGYAILERGRNYAKADYPTASGTLQVHAIHCFIAFL